MYVTISDFIKEWNREAMLTQNVLDGLTDESLKKQVYPEGRTLGRIAWHLTTNIPDYLTHFGLNIDGVKNAENVPTSAKEIAETFKEVSFLVAQIIEKQWTDKSIEQIQEAFGRRIKCSNTNGTNQAHCSSSWSNYRSDASSRIKAVWGLWTT